jgi:hypothetical protein
MDRQFILNFKICYGVCAFCSGYACFYTRQAFVYSLPLVLFNCHSAIHLSISVSSPLYSHLRPLSLLSSRSRIFPIQPKTNRSCQHQHLNNNIICILPLCKIESEKVEGFGRRKEREDGERKRVTERRTRQS